MWTAEILRRYQLGPKLKVIVQFTDGVSSSKEALSYDSIQHFDARFIDDLRGRINRFNSIAAGIGTIELGPVTIPEVPDLPSSPSDLRANKWAILKTYDPISPGVSKNVFDLADTIGVTTEIRSAASGGVLLPFSGEFSVPIFKDNGLHETVWVKKVVFTDGVASFIVRAADLGPGYYGIDDRTSTIVHAETQMITVRVP